MNYSLVFICFLFVVGCGVKGDPRPPHKPPHLDRDEPTFKDAVKDVKPIPVQKAQEKEEDKENER